MLPRADVHRSSGPGAAGGPSSDIDLDRGGEAGFDLDAPAGVGRAPDGTGGGSAAGRGRRLLLGRWPAATPAWLRGPAAVAVVALVTALVVGGLGERRHRAALESAVEVERRFAAVDVGSMNLSAATYDYLGNAVVGDDGTTDLQVIIPLTNTSDTPAAVTVTDVEIAGDAVPVTVLGPAAAAQLDPFGAGVALLYVEVDCAAVPTSTPNTPATTPDRATASVTVDGEQRTVRRGSSSWGSSLPQQLVDVCHPPGGP